MKPFAFKIVHVLPLACLFLGACGSPSARTTPGQLDTPAGGAPLKAIDLWSSAVLGGDAQLGEEANSIECLAMRAKITGETGRLHLSTPWRNVERSEAWQELKVDRSRFAGADCVWEAPEQTEECAVLQDKLNKDWDTVKQTPQWKALENDANYQALQEEVHKAREMRCYK